MTPWDPRLCSTFFEPINAEEDVSTEPDGWKPLTDAVDRVWARLSAKRLASADLKGIDLVRDNDSNKDNDSDSENEGYSNSGGENHLDLRYLRRAHRHVKNGANMPSPLQSCDQDFTAQVPDLKLVLWPHQLAAIGRLHDILIEKKAMVRRAVNLAIALMAVPTKEVKWTLTRWSDPSHLGYLKFRNRDSSQH